MQTVISVENVSKQYRLGEVGTGTISHDLNRWWSRIRGKDDPYLKVGETNDRSQKGASDYVWALRDVSFEVKQGDVLGIIGRNGAGKSTLLKILSKTTGPSTGQIKIKGRIASLLEVGTGFHPELTGRENVFLNGAILGMTKREIKAKFDEIVDFSGVERYIDTPVKRYSSGMYVRLAFAVAAHLDPDILIVDEVLAVGDAEFQKKCLGKMKDASTESGKTVLFVSHNMAAIKSLCDYGMVLENGILKSYELVDTVVAKYISGGGSFSNERYFFAEFDYSEFKLSHIKIYGNNNNSAIPVTEYDLIRIETLLEIKDESSVKYHFTYVLKNDSGEPLFTFSHINSNLLLSQGVNRIICSLPSGFLNVGSYFLDVYLIKDRRDTVFVEKDIMSFVVTEGERPIGSWMGKEPGFIKPQFEWEIF